MTRDDLFTRFKALGWGGDAQSLAIFDFMMRAREQVSPESILLDLGAGQCRYRFFFEHGRYLAADFAQGDASWDYSELDFVCDITKIDFLRDSCVDFCLNTTTLEHLREPGRFLQQVQRVLTPGGRLFLYVPFVMNEHQIPHDYFRYTRYGLRHLCETAGLDVVSLEPSNGPLYTGVRWAESGLSQVRSRRLHVRLLRRALRSLFRRALVPLFDYLDRFSTTDNFPQCWLLTARKPGAQQKREAAYDSKPELIRSLLRCPACKGSLTPFDKSYSCTPCEVEYPLQNGQIRFL